MLYDYPRSQLSLWELAMNSDDLGYYHQRAEAELERASKSECPRAVKAHYTLAGYYLDRVFGQFAGGDQSDDKSWRD